MLISCSIALISKELVIEKPFDIQPPIEVNSLENQSNEIKSPYVKNQTKRQPKSWRTGL